MSTIRSEVEERFRDLRDRICARLEELDGGKFKRTTWDRPGGGGGEMSELRGKLIEKGGCNFSKVSGDKYPSAITGGAQGEGKAPGGGENDAAIGIEPPRPEDLAGKPFFATGVSLVLHPRNPYVPVVHLNVRYLEVGDAQWFGGGTDLTPFRPFDEDTRHFHRVLEKVCN
ncbi:MAG: coproporphyrinogen III oxidase, partial [Myxococcales bacterium]